MDDLPADSRSEAIVAVQSAWPRDVSVADADGEIVPTADNLMRFDVTSPGRLIGVGNGDPSSHESDMAPQRRLFNGKCVALIQSTSTKGKIEVTVNSAVLKSAKITLPTSRVAPPPRV